MKLNILGKLMKKYALIGISPFNTKFTPEYIQSILRWAQKNYYHFDFIHPRECSQYLLTSTGTKLAIAKKKSRNEFNRVKKILSNFNIHLNSFDEYLNNEIYYDLYEKSLNFFKKDDSFSSLCRRESINAMTSKLKSKNNFEDNKNIYIGTEAINTAIEYILKEMPFLIDPIHIMYKNVQNFDSVHVCYYKNWSIFDYLYNHQSTISLKSVFQKIE